MIVADISDVFREALAVHDIFLAFGVPKDDVWVSYESKRFQVVARRVENGEPVDYRVTIADLDLDAETFARSWDSVVRQYNRSSQDEREVLVRGTKARSHMATLIFGLIASGFRTGT